MGGCRLPLDCDYNAKLAMDLDPSAKAVTLPTQVRRRPAPDRAGPLTRDAMQAAVGARYQLQRELGRGAFGVVWLAHDHQATEPCCIKFLWPEHAAGFPLVRFKREFRTARRLQHPSCVRVFEFGHRDDLWFFSMEYVAGPSLAKAQQLLGDVRAVAAVGQQILAALDKAHSRAIIHRDIKPHNILIAPATAPHGLPVAKLGDFGIARVGDLDDDDRVRALRGSLPYMAPELVVDGISDVRCDLYSLGITLYQLLSGGHPLGKASAFTDWLALIRSGQMRSLSDAAPAVPDAVARVVMRLCARDPRDRYRSAAQAYDDLAAWLTSTGGPLPDLPDLQRGPYLAAPRLVGRDSAKQQIDDFLAANLAGSAARSGATAPVLLLSGPPGVGKSRLLSWLLRASDAYGPAVLLGQCRTEVGAPFEAIAPIVSRLPQLGRQSAQRSAEVDLTQSNDAPAADLPLAPAAPAAPSRLSTAVSDRSSSDFGSGSSASGTAPPQPDGQKLRQLLHQLSDQLVAAVVRQPAVLVLEDAQWSDAETLDLLTMWARSIAAHRAEGQDLNVALVVTHRPVPADSKLAEVAAALVAEGRACTIALDELGPDATAALAGELLMHPSDEQLGTVCRQLFGDRPVTPMYVAQVLQLLMARGYLTRPGQAWSGLWDFSRIDQTRPIVPATLTDAIGERAARLSIDTKALLAAAAVLGRRFALQTASTVAGVDDDLARDCVEEAERSGFVADDPTRADGDGFAFSHDRFREALYQTLDGEQRRHLHGAAAAALLGQSPRKGRDVAADLAHHYHCADLHEPAFQFSCLAADQAMRHHHGSRAAQLYAWAVQHAEASGRPVTSRLLERLGDAAGLALDVDRAQAAYWRILASSPPRLQRMRIFLRLGQLHHRAQHSDLAWRNYDRVIAAGLPGMVRPAATRWLFVLATTLVLAACPLPVIVSWHRLVLGRRGRRSAKLVQQASLSACLQAFHNGRPGKGLQYGVIAIVSGFRKRTATRDAGFAISAAFMQMFSGMFGAEARARRWAARGAGVATDSWDLQERQFYHHARGGAALWLAQEEPAIAELQAAFALATDSKDPLYVEVTTRLLCAAYLFLCRFDQLIATTRGLRRFARQEGLDSLESTLLFWEFLAHGYHGDVDASARALAQLQAIPEDLLREDEMAKQARSLFELWLEAAVQGPSAALAQRVLDIQDDFERRPISQPVVTVTGHLFGLALAIATRLDPLPADLRRRLARVRHRRRPLETLGRWRQPCWLINYAIYDAMIGKQRRASKELNAALEIFRRHNPPSPRKFFCALGEMAFPAGSTLAQRCTESLAELAANRPDTGVLIERQRRILRGVTN
jgi:serine/threonine protein kinase